MESCRMEAAEIHNSGKNLIELSSILKGWAERKPLLKESHKKSWLQFSTSHLKKELWWNPSEVAEEENVFYHIDRPAVDVIWWVSKQMFTSYFSSFEVNLKQKHYLFLCVTDMFEP